MASTTTASPSYGSTRAPVWLVWAAVAGLLVSAALVFMQSLPMSIVGYVLAPLAVTALVSVFRYKDVLASRSNTYSRDLNSLRIATIVVVASFLVGIAHAWIIATDIAKAVG